LSKVGSAVGIQSVKQEAEEVGKIYRASIFSYASEELAQRVCVGQKNQKRRKSRDV
jgi:hypothetical protein